MFTLPKTMMQEPSYGETLEEQGRYQARPVLPFSAYGTMAMLHPPDEPNGASTAAFWCVHARANGHGVWFDSCSRGGHPKE